MAKNVRKEPSSQPRPLAAVEMVYTARSEPSFRNPKRCWKGPTTISGFGSSLKGEAGRFSASRAKALKRAARMGSKGSSVSFEVIEQLTR